MRFAEDFANLTTNCISVTYSGARYRVRTCDPYRVKVMRTSEIKNFPSVDDPI